MEIISKFISPEIAGLDENQTYPKLIRTGLFTAILKCLEVSDEKTFNRSIAQIGKIGISRQGLNTDIFKRER